MHAAGRIASLTLLSLILSTPSHAQGGGAAAGCPRRGTATAEDCEAVRRAAFDYIEGFYEGDSTKLVRSIRPEVFKYGFWRPRDSTSYKGETMTWAEILKFARDVKERGRPAPATTPRGVELLEVQDHTAAARVNAYWGTDYVLVGKYGGRWMISHVLWQSPPPK